MKILKINICYITSIQIILSFYGSVENKSYAETKRKI